MLPDDYDWLSQLRPNHALTALYTGKHFLMYGFIGLFILILCIIIVRYCLCRYKRYQRQQKILQQINRAEQIYLKNNQLMSLIESYNMMMKRTLREYYPEINVASMSGIQWLSCLDKTGKTTDFLSGPGFILGMHYQADSLYQTKPALLQTVVRKWVRQVCDG